MDEEFFFPQNVRTNYRLWIFGPRHLKRLAVAPVLVILVAWPIVRHSLFAAMLAASLVATAYVATVCVPLLGDEDTLVDIGLKIRKHRRGQTRFALTQEEVGEHANVVD